MPHSIHQATGNLNYHGGRSLQRIAHFVFIFLTTLSSIHARVDTTRILAFPGAEGFGKYVTGGRGGLVYIVSNLNDSGLGSLRWALEAKGPRTVVFEVSGNIELKSRLNVGDGNLTVAGQTAPGDGITLKNFPLRIVGMDNIIIRFIRVRLGDIEGKENDAFEAIRSKNLIIDHCSFSWGTDETCSIYDVENTTIQYCIISEGLNNSIHKKGAHGFGGLLGGYQVSFFRNLMAHFWIRMPSRTSMGKNGIVDIRENVFYNWGFRAADNGANTTTNFVRNYFKPGPATYQHPSADLISKRFLNPTMQEGDPKTYGRFYLEENTMPTIDLTNNQWLGVRLENNSYQRQFLELCMNKDQHGQAIPFSILQNTYHDSLGTEQAYLKVITESGASLSRDSVDLRITEETAKGSFTFTGSKTGLRGIIDSQQDVGGWPILRSLPAPVDIDRDGMPDEWEIKMGLNPEKRDDRFFDLHPNYTNLEVYLNSLLDRFESLQTRSIEHF